MTTIMILYLTVDAYIRYRTTDGANIVEYLKDGIMPIALIGGLILIFGIYSDLTWPLQINSPSAAANSAFAGYNLLFFDPLVLMGIVTLSFAITVKYGHRLQTFGIMALYSGVFSMYYGWMGYLQNKSSEPFDMFLMYVAFGAVGILSYPLTLMADYSRYASKGVMKNITLLILLLFWIALIGSAV
ncbi:membrane protein containing DUF981, partial [mine drainage metagenome]